MVVRNLFTSSSKIVVITLITLVIFFIIAEMATGIFFYYCLPGNTTTLEIKAKRETTRLSNLNFDGLILGDSAAGTSLDVDVLKNIAGFDFLHLDTPARTTAFGNYCILEDYLRSGNKKPQLILYMTVYDMWCRDMNDDLFQQVIVNNYSDKIPEIVFNKHMISKPYISLFIHVIKYSLPSQKYKWEIERLMSELADGENVVSIWKARNSYFEDRIIKITDRSTDSSADLFIMENRERAIINDCSKQIQFCHNNQFEVSALNDYYFRKILALCEQENISVLFCYPACYEEFYYSDSGQYYFSDMKDYLGGLEQEYSSFTQLTDDFYITPIECLTNSVDHMHKNCRSNYSMYIGSLLNNIFSP